MKTRYTVIDHKKNMKFTYYYKWQWELAFALIFITGTGLGLLISFIVFNGYI